MRARLKCAELLEKTGQNERALNIYEKLSEGSGKEAKSARERIKVLKQYTR